MGMAARKVDPAAEPADDNESIQFNVRIPRFLLRDLDTWLADINKGRRVGLLNRSELVRLIIDRACRERPDLEGK